MSVATRMSLLSFFLLACASSFLQASEVAREVSQEVDSDGAVTGSRASDESLSEELRWYIKRQAMSKPGVMLDMANMTDSGYTWTNDVVWAGSGLPIDEPWYVAGFVFQRPGYKNVWLQYAFTFTQATGELRNFKRWYGAGTFR